VDKSQHPQSQCAAIRLRRNQAFEAIWLLSRVTDKIRDFRPMITAVLFDFGGTLDGPAHWLDRFVASYRAAGLEISREELDPAFEHATRAGYRASRVLTRLGLAELVRFLAGQQIEFIAESGPAGLRERLRKAGPKGRFAIVEKITESFVGETRAGLAQSANVLKALGQRFALGVVSNFYGNLERVLAECGVRDLLGAIADSGVEGVFKPEPAIFRTALDVLRVAPSSAAMVGDSLEKDCAPARQLGMRAVWYRPRASRTPGAGARNVADYTIGALEELKSLQWE
jgi:FMN phosphatase YigB (HAD superfamily)